MTYFILQLIDARFTSQSRKSIAPHQKSGRAQLAAKGGPKQLDVLSSCNVWNSNSNFASTSSLLYFLYTYIYADSGSLYLKVLEGKILHTLY